MTRARIESSPYTEVNFPAPPSISLAKSNVTANKGQEHLLTVGIPRPEDVANVLLRLASLEEEPDYLTHLRLQKLMYYVQAWSLALRKRPAFQGRIEAWAHGPVVKELFSKLADYKSNPIPHDALKKSSPVSEQDYQFILSVWEQYKGFTAFALRSMTHNETPWIQARNGFGPADACSSEITHEAMRSYFSQHAH
jgi:uncharacterized phage-associated protein